MNFGGFSGPAPGAQHFKLGYEGCGTVVHETRYQNSNVQLVGDVKFRPDVVVVSAGVAPQTVNTGVKYQIAASSSVSLSGVLGGLDAPLKAEQRDDIMAIMQQQGGLQQGQQVLVVLHEPKDTRVKQEARAHVPAEFISLGDVGDAAWQALGGGEYLSLPLQLLRCPERREDGAVLVNMPVAAAAPPPPPPAPVPALVPLATKKKKKKKFLKEKKPRPKPGEVRLTTALDGSTLYCCPECHMAYPERGLLDQHLVGHTLERRYICDICNAALKRKDHLTRHRQSHNPERPHVCSVCLKAFKRKEQLTLHFIIHSGEKRHVCNECGKGFYRKDHLRKHTRSHIARRVKAELALGGRAGRDARDGLAAAVPAPQP